MAKSSPRRPPSASPSWPRWLEAALLAALFLVLTAWSWRKWGDVFVDFGHELYIPWQLAEGRVLYRDLAYFMGPLSQYANAALFRLFGVSFTTLIAANLAILAGITAALHTLFSRALGRAAGTVMAAVFLLLFAFAHYVRVGNYNYVGPYLHEQSHGVALGLLALVLLERAARRPSAAATAAVGAVVGFTFLTKAEAFVPALAAALAAGAVLQAAWRPPLATALRTAGVFLGAALVPVAAAMGFLASQMPFAQAWRGLVGNWVYIFDRDLILADPFYSKYVGVVGMAEQMREIFTATAWLGAFVVVALGLERVLRGRGRGASAAAGVLVAIGLGLSTSYPSWIQVARTLPLVCAAATAAYLWLCWKQRGQPAFLSHFILALWSVFSLASLGKMILKARFEHYGFALAMPGTLLLVALLLFVVPRVLQSRGGSGEAWRAASVAAILVGTGWLVWLSNVYYDAKRLPIGSGGDLLYGFDPRFHRSGALFASALETLQGRSRPGETLVVLPDGVLLNYLTRLSNPTPYTLLTPWEMKAFGGEDAVFARIAPTKPDWVVLTRQDMSEFGSAHFGFDAAYGQRIRHWVEQNYDVVANVGEDQKTKVSWLVVYRRRATS